MVYSLTWNKSIGSSRSGDNFGLFKDKPTLSFAYDSLMYRDDGRSVFIVGDNIIKMTDAQKAECKAMATTLSTVTKGTALSIKDVVSVTDARYAKIGAPAVLQSEIDELNRRKPPVVPMLTVKQSDGQGRVDKVNMLKTKDMTVEAGDNQGEVVISPKLKGLHVESIDNVAIDNVDSIHLIGLKLIDDGLNQVTIEAPTPVAPSNTVTVSNGTDVFAGVDNITFADAEITGTGTSVTVTPKAHPAPAGTQLTFANVANPKNLPEVQVNQMDLVYPLEATKQGDTGILRLVEGTFEPRSADSFLAYMSQEKVLYNNLGTTQATVWFDDIIVDHTGYDIGYSILDKAYSIQEGDALDPNLTDGVNFIIVNRLSLKGNASEDGTISIVLYDKMNDVTLTDIDGNPMAISRHYKSGEPLGDIDLVGAVNAKGAIEFQCKVESTFRELLTLADRTEGGSCIMIQSLKGTNHTGLGLLQLENDLGKSLKFNIIHLKDKFYSLRSMLTDNLSVSQDAGHITMSDGFTVATNSKTTISIDRDDKFTISDTGNPLYFGIGYTLDYEKTVALRGKFIEANAVVDAKDNAFFIRAAYTPDKDNKEEVVTGDSNMQPILGAGWTLIPDKDFIPEGQTPSTTTTLRVQVPDTAAQVAMFLTPVEGVSPCVLNLHDFSMVTETPVTRLIMGTLLDSKSSYLHQSDQYAEFAKKVSTSLLRYTVNSGDTFMPIGSLLKGKAPVSVKGYDQNQTGEQGRLHIDVDATLSISTSFTAYAGEKAGDNPTITLWWAKVIGDKKYEKIPLSERTVPLRKETPTIGVIPAFKVKANAGDEFVIIAKSDVDDGAFLQAARGQFIIQNIIEAKYLTP